MTQKFDSGQGLGEAEIFASCGGKAKCMHPLVAEKIIERGEGKCEESRVNEVPRYATITTKVVSPYISDGSIVGGASFAQWI